jgi:hypothetical protein
MKNEAAVKKVKNDLKGFIIKTFTHHANFEMDVVSITSDRLKLFVGEYRKLIVREMKWQIPASICLSLWPSVIANDFDNTGFFSSGEWRAVFLTLATMATLWLIWEVFPLIYYRLSGLSEASLLNNLVAGSKISKAVLKKKRGVKPQTYVIDIPSGTSKEVMGKVSSLLKSNPGSDTITISLPGGKKIDLPYTVDMTPSLNRVIKNLIKDNVPF